MRHVKMYATLFLFFVISFVQSDDNLQIPNVADLPVFPGSVGTIGNSDQGNGPPGGFRSLGLVPLTNIGSGPVGNIGQDNNGQGNIGNLPIGPQNNGQAGSNQNNGQGGSNQNNGQGGSNQNNGQDGSNQNNEQGNSNQNNGQDSSNQNNGQDGSNQNDGQGGSNQNNGQGGSNQNNGQGGVNQINGQGGFGNLPESNGQSGIGSSQIINSQNNGQGGNGNLPLPGSANNGQGGFGNRANNGQGGFGNFPIIGSQNNGLAGLANFPIGFQNNGLPGLGNFPLNSQNNGPNGFGNIPNIGIGNLPITGSQNNGQGGIGNLPIIGSQNNGQGSIGNLPIIGSQNNGQGSIGNLPIIGSQNNGQGVIGNLPITGSQNNGQGGFGNSPNIGLGGFGNLPNIIQPNDLTGIERPCQVFDIHCIRRYFKKNGKCREARKPVPEPYYRAQSSLQISKINATFSAFNVLYEGLNGRINEFYINRNTDRLVISIEFRNVTFFSRDVYYRFYRRGREPITTKDYLYINYRSYITTTIIPKIRDLQLYKSETTTFTNDAIPAFSIGPNAFSYPDTTVQLARLELLKNIPIAIREAQLTEGPFYAATFIQNSICDFKLKVL